MKEKSAFWTIAILVWCVCISNPVNSQTIFTGINNSVVNLPCNQSCPTLNFTVPHLKSDEDYRVVSIPYTPYAYTTPTGNELMEMYDDDIYSDAINLPFPICFYGRVYNQVVVGSNGLLTFDEANANCFNAYNIPAGNAGTIPRDGGTRCATSAQQQQSYYPAASIMGIYADLDASSFASSEDRKVEWRFEGAAPFRRFIASWYQIGSFRRNNSSDQCGVGNNGNYTTFQIVVNEATAVIEVFIENYNCPDRFNNGRAILGIQNHERDRAVAAPGKNAQQWTARNEGYRFIPSGATSRFIRSEIYNIDGTTLRGTSTNNFSEPTEVGISFQNICFTGSTEQFIVKTFYSVCTNASEEIVINDTITVNRDFSFNPTFSTTNTLCGSPSGSITLNMPTDTGMANFTYILNGTASIIGTGRTHTFNDLAQGVYNVEVADASGYCSATLTDIVVGKTNNLAADLVPVSTSCPTVNNGSITVTPTTGAGPYQFSLNGAEPVSHATSYTFNNLASGNYTVVVTDASGCTTQALPVTVAVGSGLTANVVSNATTCAGATNGSILVTPTNGTAPFAFTLNPGNITINGNTAEFTGLANGNYSITIRDAIGCETAAALQTSVAMGGSLTATATPTATSCVGATNGSILVTPQTGTVPFTFVLNPGNIIQTGATANFQNLAPGNYTVSMVDDLGCSLAAPLNIAVQNGPAFTATATSTPTICAGATNGTIAVTPAGTIGSGPYSYVLNGEAAVTQPGNHTFTGLAVGNYTIRVINSEGCTTAPINVTVTSGATLSTTSTISSVSCYGGNDGAINVATPTIGQAPYEYSIDGTNWQTSTSFTGLPAATYQVYLREANGCTGQISVVVPEPVPLTATGTITPATCNGAATGSITVQASGGTGSYQYSIDNGINWQSSASFNNLATGNYTISIRDASNCQINIPVDVTEPLALAATISSTTDATCLNPGIINVTASGGNGNYEYSIDGTTFQSSATLSVTTGTYTITVRDGRGCTFSIPDVVVGFTNDLTFTPPADETICEGDIIQLNIETNATAFAWLPTQSLNNPSIANPLASPVATTQYQIELTRGTCTANTALTVNVNPAPVANVGADGFICYGQSFQLSGSGGATYSWLPAASLDNPSIPNPTATPNSTTTYSLTVTDAIGCSSIIPATVTVDVTPPIQITAYPADTVVYEGAQFWGVVKSVATDYVWSPVFGLSNPFSDSTRITAGATGSLTTYTIVGTTQAGCRGEGTMTVRVYEGPELYTPTAFTPNGDGKNDLFFPFPVGIRELNYFRVYNRWGNLIFSTKTLHHGWDGKWNGIPQPADVYVWMAEGIDDNGNKITKKETVTLVR